MDMDSEMYCNFSVSNRSPVLIALSAIGNHANFHKPVIHIKFTRVLFAYLTYLVLWAGEGVTRQPNLGSLF